MLQIIDKIKWPWELKCPSISPPSSPLVFPHSSTSAAAATPYTLPPRHPLLPPLLLPSFSSSSLLPLLMKIISTLEIILSVEVSTTIAIMQKRF